MIAGRVQGSRQRHGLAPHSALAEITSPNLFKIICSNPSNRTLVLDEFVVPKDSPIKSHRRTGRQEGGLRPRHPERDPGEDHPREERHREPAPSPSCRSVSTCRPLAAGQVDAVYTLEPTGTAGRLTGPDARAGARRHQRSTCWAIADAPWFGGSASVTTAFLKEQAGPGQALHRRLRARRWTGCARTPTKSRKPAWTASRPSRKTLVKEVPLSGFTLYNEFKPSDIDYFQKFFDVFSDRKIFSKPAGGQAADLRGHDGMNNARRWLPLLGPAAAVRAVAADDLAPNG